MSGITCDIVDCHWNDDNGNCECDSIYISDSENREPMCMSAEFREGEYTKDTVFMHSDY